MYKDTGGGLLAGGPGPLQVRGPEAGADLCLNGKKAPARFSGLMYSLFSRSQAEGEVVSGLCQG